MLQGLDTRKIDASGIILLVVFSAAAYLFGIEPILARQAELRTHEAEVQAKREAAEEAARALTETRKQVEQAERAVADNPLRLESEHRLNARLAEIAATATRCGLQIDQLEPSRATSSEHYVTVPIRVTGRSSFRGAARFLHELRSSMPDVAVATLELTGDPRGRDSSAKVMFALMWHASPAQGG